ncbi:MAG: hypothetical protein ABW022_09200 [Actinoplanes sp.]
MAGRRSGAWAGWVTFAGTMLFVIGSINIFEGFLALISNESVVATEEHFVLVDLTSWGWTLIVAGLVLVAVGVGLMLGASWARFTAIVVLGLHAAAQVVWLGAYPVWSLLMIALDTIVIFALTARWHEVRPYDDGGAVASGDPLGGRMPHQTVTYGPKLT